MDFFRYADGGMPQESLKALLKCEKLINPTDSAISETLSVVVSKSFFARRILTLLI